MNITVYLGANSGNNPVYRESVRELGSWIGENRHTLVYGGSKCGLMGELADSALEAGGYVIGVEPSFFIEAVKQHEGVQELIEVKDMPERKAQMIDLGDAFIAFPGGTGTLEEISEVMSKVCLGHSFCPCIVYNVNGYYDDLERLLDRMKWEGFLTTENRAKLLFARSIEDIDAFLHLTCAAG